MTDIATRKAKLVEKLNEMNARLLKVEDALDDPMPKDWEEAAQEREDDEVLEEVGHAAQREKSMIVAALERIVSKEYGFCAQCGEDIAEERLDVLPYTPVCAKCAK
ncbi:MAG: TraR/DksA family transcriptional regulator [Rhodobacteraceae bacterium]|nr:TraR/DksA family transcriptional regulator [Paracoccaceae bacterium]